MSENYKPSIKKNAVEELEPVFLKDDRFLEFLVSKEVDLSKYKDDFIEIWKFKPDLYINFHNSFTKNKDAIVKNLNLDKTEEESDRNKLIVILIKLLETLDPSAVGQLLKVFREIKRIK